MRYLFILVFPLFVYAQDVMLFCKSVEDMYRACSKAGAEGVDCQSLGSRVYNKMVIGVSPKVARDFSVLCMASCVAEQIRSEEIKRDIEHYIKRCKAGDP